MSAVHHFHGYKPWVGSAEEFNRTGLARRRPPRRGTDVDGSARQAYLDSEMLPIEVGRWLEKRRHAHRSRTWTQAGDALAWLKQTWLAHPERGQPFVDGEGGNYLPLDVKLTYAEQDLRNGVDVAWVYYVGGGLAAYAVVCCPNRFHPAIACPLPPARAEGPDQRAVRALSSR
ncbi:hypothetical protein AB0F93_28385 [Micromonospora tulbaghiae]|uniref:hypothetical protein n=1 Tax=Micromonospora tulbaghiae TaxID=479978 RepID=UPI00332103BA